MTKWTTIFLIILLVIDTVTIAVAQAQSLSNSVAGTVASTAINATSKDKIVGILGVDPTAFPKVKVNFLIDKFCAMAGNLKKENFKVKENGRDAVIDNSSFAGNASGQKLDLAIVFDNTGSMQPEIDAMKSKVKELTDTIKASGLDASYSLVSFNDSVSVKTKWTKDQAIIKKNVDALYAEGGGDEPEDSMDAIETVLSMGFRPDAQKIVLVITDAHAHYKNDSSGFSKYTKDEVEKDLKESGVTFIPISPTFEKQNGFVDLKEIANDIKSMWIDINSGQFPTILEQFKGIITGTYVVEYTSPHPLHPGTGLYTVTVDAPGCVVGSDLSSYIKQVSVPTSTETKPNGAAIENERWNNNRLIEGRLIENNSILTFKGSIGREDLQEKFVNVPNGTSKLSANMSAEDGNGDIAFSSRSRSPREFMQLLGQKQRDHQMLYNQNQESGRYGFTAITFLRVVTNLSAST